MTVEEVVINTVGTLCSLGIVLCIVMIGVTIKNSADQQKALQEDNCQQASSVPTGKRVYCGKACWRDEMKIEYSCKSGVKIVYQ